MPPKTEMATINLLEIIKYIFPKELTDYFDVIQFEEENNYLRFYLEERNVPPDGYSKDEVLSKGFYDPIEIQDFPLRERAVYLNIKRRRWKEKATNKILHRDWNTVAQGTKLTQEFADFLKEIYRYTTHK